MNFYCFWESERHFFHFSLIFFLEYIPRLIPNRFCDFSSSHFKHYNYSKSHIGSRIKSNQFRLFALKSQFNLEKNTFYLTEVSTRNWVFVRDQLKLWVKFSSNNMALVISSEFQVFVTFIFVSSNLLNLRIQTLSSDFVEDRNSV